MSTVDNILTAAWAFFLGLLATVIVGVGIAGYDRANNPAKQEAIEAAKVAKCLSAGGVAQTDRHGIFDWCRVGGAK